MLSGAAVEDSFVATGVIGDGVEGVHEQAAEALALMVLGDADFLNVADGAAVVDAYQCAVSVLPAAFFLLRVSM